MFTYSNAYSGFSANNPEAIQTFYSEVLGLKVTKEEGILRLHIKDDAWVLVYPKPNHEPASYTILNFEVSDIEEAVRNLKQKGVTFEHYPGTYTGEDGISRAEGGPLIAWFKDPAGNILSVLQAH